MQFPSFSQNIQIRLVPHLQVLGFAPEVTNNAESTSLDVAGHQQFVSSVWNVSWSVILSRNLTRRIEDVKFA